MQRRGLLRSALVATAMALGVGRFPTVARAKTKHIRIYVEMDVPPEREREMLDAFHNAFVPEAVKYEGYVRVKLLKRRTILQGTPSPQYNYGSRRSSRTRNCA